MTAQFLGHGIGEPTVSMHPMRGEEIWRARGQTCEDQFQWREREAVVKMDDTIANGRVRWCRAAWALRSASLWL
jgi:hypothetical protein